MCRRHSYQAASLQNRRYSKCEFVFHLDDPGTACYILALGQVKIGVVSPEGKQVSLAMLRPGDFFGEMAALAVATRDSVYKWLGLYQQRGLIKLDGGKVIIRPEPIDVEFPRSCEEMH